MVSFKKLADLYFEILNCESLCLSAHFQYGCKQNCETLRSFVRNILLLHLILHDLRAYNLTFSPSMFACAFSELDYLMEFSSPPFS